MIVMASDMNERNSRNANSLNVYMYTPNVEVIKNTVTNTGGKVWNGVPNNIQNAPSATLTLTFAISGVI